MISIKNHRGSPLSVVLETLRMAFHIHGWMSGDRWWFGCVRLQSPLSLSPDEEGTGTLLGRWIKNILQTRALLARRNRSWLARLAKPDIALSQVARQVNLTTVSTYHLKKASIKLLDKLNRFSYVQTRYRNQHDYNNHYTQL